MKLRPIMDLGDAFFVKPSSSAAISKCLVSVMTLQLGWFGAPAVAQSVGKPSIFTPRASAEGLGRRNEAADGEIIVIRKRRGDADVASETEFNESEVASEGAYDIQELLNRLQPFIDPTGTPPLLLINGRPAGFDRSILAYPPEALEKVALLKPEASVRYGANPAQRVVNLVLKPKFASYEAGGSVNFATAGGQLGQDLNVARFAINGDMRWSAKVKAGHQSELRKSSRNVPAAFGMFDSGGFVTGINGSEIDPTLSQAAGEIVSVAAVPDYLVTPPSLEAFLATANRRNPVDANAFETLQPSSQNLSVGLGVSYPIGSFSASLSLDANRSKNAGSSGLPMVLLTLPSTNPWSPFDTAVFLYRPFAGLRALQSRNDLETVSTSLTIDGRALGFQTNLALIYSRSSSRSLQETGIAAEKLQDLIDGNDLAFNPYAPITTGKYLKGSRTRSNSSNMNMRVNLQRSLLSLPTGSLGWNFSAAMGQAKSTSTTTDIFLDIPTTTRSDNAQWSGQMSLNLPISRRESKFGLLGDLLLDATFGYAGASGSAGQDTMGLSATWRPLSQIQISGSINRSSVRATVSQTSNPTVTTVNRIFDFKRQEIAEPIWTTGGNSELDPRRSRQENVNMALQLTPFSNQDFTLGVNYHRSKATDGVAGFPELTPVVEAAFPERINRDSEGRLVAVDARPISIKHSVSSDLDSTLAFRLGGRRQRNSGHALSSLIRDPLQFSFAVTHHYLLRDETLIRRGLPVIDRLNDNSGVSRQTVDLQFGFGERAFGSNLGITWGSPSTVRAEDAAFRVKPPLLFNLSAFINPDRLFEGWSDISFIRKLKISLNVTNLFNGYRRVIVEDTVARSVYTRDEINPLGRTVLITIQKQL
ncbi:hypothetical protein [Novosphingobium sp.]|uniref:hypothetical protein n=1 Tax=Novosphingobium sp. TaxID=1874826 RepID=UPI0028A8D07A|nr:hypothetical protein [Novosphingobium sp.]